MRIRWFPLLASTIAASLSASSAVAAPFVSPPPILASDAAAMANIAQTWPQLQQAAQSYGGLAPYAAATWAGPGPQVRVYLGYPEQCHNTHWDQVTQYLVTGCLNIAGDAEAEAYALQAVATDYPQQLSEYLVQLAQSGNPKAQALANEILAQKGPLLTSLNDLTTLLNTTGTQLADAMGPNTALQPLPISQWQAGIGDAPNLAAAKYIPGPNDGMPIGWAVFIPQYALHTRLEDLCPTGTASLPTLPLKAQVMNAVQQAISDEPDLGQTVGPLENGSTWSAPQIFYGFSSTGAPTRERLVAALAADETGIAGYMAPITQALVQYNQEIQQIQQEIDSSGGVQ